MAAPFANRSAERIAQDFQVLRGFPSAELMVNDCLLNGNNLHKIVLF